MIKQVTSIIEFTDLIDFILDGNEEIARMGCDRHDENKTLAVFRDRLHNDNFALFVDFHETTPYGFITLLTSVDLFGELEGWVWTMFCMPGAHTKELVQTAEDWFHTKGVKTVYALNGLHEAYKDRWLRMQKFTKKSTLYKREI